MKIFTQTRHSPYFYILTLAFFTVMLFLYVPLIYLAVQAFLVHQDNWKSGWTLLWLKKCLHNDLLMEPFFQSIIIASVSATLAVVIGTLGALGLRHQDQVKPWVQALIFVPLLIPEIVTGLSLLLFFVLTHFPLGRVSVILAHSSFSTCFVYFIICEQLRRLDPSMEEAAKDLGAHPPVVFWKVTFPNIIPGLIGGWLMAFTLSFDDFLISFFTSGANVTTLPLKIYSMMRVGASPELYALSFFMVCMSSLLIVLVMTKERTTQWVTRRSSS